MDDIHSWRVIRLVVKGMRLILLHSYVSCFSLINYKHGVGLEWQTWKSSRCLANMFDHPMQSIQTFRTDRRRASARSVRSGKPEILLPPANRSTTLFQLSI